MGRTRIRSIETVHEEERRALFRALGSLDRRTFLKVSAAALGATLAKGLVPPHSFQPVSLAYADPANGADRTLSFAYISDAHLYERSLNDRFVNAILRAVDDVNALDPQPDFVLFGGDLAQLGQPGELALGAEILRSVKAPVHMMVGEHDWYFDLGEEWQQRFGKPTYSFDHKGVHFVVLNSVLEEDFWTARKLSPMDRMRVVAGLDNSIQSRFEVGAAQRQWLAQDLAKLKNDAPVVVFSHSPLYEYYEPWNFWTKDARDVQKILGRFRSVVVIHGHTHQVLTHRIGNIHFQGMLSTAWPWPYAPEGLPKLTVQMRRANPLDPQDGCGDGRVRIHADGLADIVQNLWNRNPVTISRTYTATWGKKDAPERPVLVSY